MRKKLDSITPVKVFTDEEIEQIYSYLASDTYKAVIDFSNSILFTEERRKVHSRNRSYINKLIRNYHKAEDSAERQWLAERVKSYGAFLKRSRAKSETVRAYNSMCMLYMHNNLILPDPRMIAQHQHITKSSVYTDADLTVDGLTTFIFGVDALFETNEKTTQRSHKK